MTEVAVIALTATVIILAALRGWNAGGPSAMSATARVVGTWIAAIAGATVAFQLEWFWPLGLSTPLAIAVCSGLLLRSMLRAPAAARAPQAPSRTQRTIGLVVGGVWGTAAAASVWLVVLAAAGLTLRSDDADATGTERAGWGACLTAAARTAQRGFLQHLPIVGSVSVELEALIVVLDAEPGARRRLASEEQWSHLATLPEMLVVLDDESIQADIEAVRNGNLLALYRLQRHPAVIALARCDAVRRATADLRPSVLARRLER